MVMIVRPADARSSACWTKAWTRYRALGGEGVNEMVVGEGLRGRKGKDVPR